MNAAPGPRPRPDASMTLLNEVMKRPLDPGYAAAARRRAERRAAGESTEPRVPAHVVAMLVAVGLGMIVTVAVLHLRAPQPAATQARSLLADQVVERSLQIESLTDRSVALAAAVDELENAGTLPSSLREANDRDKLTNGTTAVSGPGLVVTLTDGGLADDEGDQRVWDTDLQFVVNALWASGAEAIAVGGERLTAVSAIRSAGDAILVDLQPLNGPSYRVEAIGDPEKLQVEFARSSGPAYLQVLGTQGIESGVQSAEELLLPAGRPQTLRWAAQPGPGSGGPEPGDEESGGPEPGGAEPDGTRNESPAGSRSPGTDPDDPDDTAQQDDTAKDGA
ncbi:DUF881 domain-containing protein [Myceligenerans xiligouense]|uniref:Uncharacterized protein YlxW (UPF0749 family) n=1 Tax=Myceligenerans xiligouense TaxID=253184 RepID=A0A3N4YLR0_9MICO|nr:DUF881 domain-containing protein [Myceligenerans xiligouense]RPF21593.1 uncharacterized protein YlxW (UPF0749 family) [Myceligenerans xiligouense]